MRTAQTSEKPRVNTRLRDPIPPAADAIDPTSIVPPPQTVSIMMALVFVSSVASSPT